MVAVGRWSGGSTGTTVIRTLRRETDERVPVGPHKLYGDLNTHCDYSLDDDTTLDQVRDGYDELAATASDLDRTVSPWGDSHFQQFYSWPVTRPVLPDVSDSRVLLAGCGRGDHVPWFHEQGATVVGVDDSGATSS